MLARWFHIQGQLVVLSPAQLFAPYMHGTMIVLAHKHRFGTSARGQNPAASSTLLFSPCALVVSWVQSRRLLRLAAHRVPHRFWTFVNQQDLVGWVVYSTAMWSPRWELRFAAFGYS